MWFLFCGKTQEKTYQPRKKTKKIQRKKLNQNHLGRHLESMRASTKGNFQTENKKRKHHESQPSFIHLQPCSKMSKKANSQQYIFPRLLPSSGPLHVGTEIQTCSTFVPSLSFLSSLATVLSVEVRSASTFTVCG